MRKRRGFTLVEVLIVVVILAILGAMVLPQFGRATEDSKESALIYNLKVLRSQVESYRMQHDDKYPGALTSTSQEFFDQMTKPTKADGSVGTLGDPNFPYGPYLKKNVPANPFNGGTGVAIVVDVPTEPVDESATVTIDAASVTVGWFFDPVKGLLKANASGSTLDGTAYEDL